MTVLYEHGIQFRPAAEILKEDLETAHESQQDFHDLGQGCREYFGNFGPTRNLNVCERKSEQLVFECNLPNEAPYPSCKVFINIDSRTSAIFTFSRKFKDQIWSIDDFIRSFLQSHRAS